MENSGYTKLDNIILFNQEISAQAKIFYIQFVDYSTIPNFVIRKATMIKASGLKGNTIDKYLKELKDLALIEVCATRVGKKYEYHYEVAIEAESTEMNSGAVKKRKNKREPSHRSYRMYGTRGQTGDRDCKLQQSGEK